MNDSAKYSVSTTGGLMDGFDSDKVTSDFSALFKIAPEKAALYTSQAKVIKKGLTLAGAEKYRDSLVKLGLGIDILDAMGKAVSQTSDQLEMVPMEDAPAEKSASSGVVSDIELVSAKDAADDGFRCPKCELAQEPTEQCVSCGVYVEKFTSAQSAYGMAGSTMSASGRTGGQAGKPKAANEKVEVEDDSLSMQGLAFAAFAAVAGAFVWYLIANQFGYEVGFVAWGIGGAVGLAAALGGSRSDLAGVACGVLVVLAIFGGKYMAMSSFASEFQASYSADASESEDAASYQEFLYDANAFGELNSTDDDAVKNFMVDHSFIYVDAVSAITNEELAYFRDEYQPGLEQQLQSPMSFEQWQVNYMGEMEAVFQELSPVKMVIDSLALMDIIFLLLGISTAFQLARQGRDA